MMVDETCAIYGGPRKIREQQIMLEEYPRPQSVINIVEIPDASETNPQPDNDVGKSLGGLVSSHKLKELGGVSNLFDLHELTVKVDTSEISIGNVGAMAPNLKKLNLNNSFITSLRDLGTSLNNLNTLWLSRCCLAELDGISCIPTLKELFVAYNDILDLSPLSMLENIEVLDLEGNNVDDVTQVEFLSLCSNLRVLTMKGNPIEHSPTPTTNKKDLKFYSYRDVILSCLPQLSMLDDVKFIEEVVDGKKTKRDNPNLNKPDEVFTDDFQIICDCLKSIETDVSGEMDDDTEATTLRPLSARLRCQSAKSNSSSNSEPTSTSSPEKMHSSKDVLFQHRDDSVLTQGKVLCGNPVQALRKRCTSKTPPKGASKSAKPKSSVFRAEHSYLSVEEDAMDKSDVLEQLKMWRLENNSLFQDGADPCNTPPKSTDKSDTSIVYSPSPPTKPKPPQTLRSRRAFGVDQPIDEDRPHSAADFRRPAFRADANASPNSLEVIDEHIASSPTLPSRIIKSKEHRPARPSTARAALQSTRDIVNTLPDVT